MTREPETRRLSLSSTSPTKSAPAPTTAAQDGWPKTATPNAPEARAAQVSAGAIAS